jgi:branched-chain amino acid transport system permease protein
MKHARLILFLTLLGLALFSIFLEGPLGVLPGYGYIHQIILTIGINAIAAVSLNLILGYTGQFSLGHSAFMAVGAYTTAAWLLNMNAKVTGLLGGSDSVIGINVSLFVALILSGLVAAVFGFIVGLPSLRLRGDYLAIVTLGFGFIIPTLILNIDALGGARGLGGIPTNGVNVFWILGTAAVTVYCVLALVNSTYGRGYLTVRDDEIAAEAMGINTTRYKLGAFITGAFFAGVAGGLFACMNQYINPGGFDFFYSVSFVIMVILGGMGSTTGAVLAAIILSILPEILRQISQSPAVPVGLKGLLEDRLIPYSVLLFILMMTRPQGLFGNVDKPRKKLVKTEK